MYTYIFFLNIHMLEKFADYSLRLLLLAFFVFYWMDAWFSTFELALVFVEFEFSDSESTALFIFAWDKIELCVVVAVELTLLLVSLLVFIWLVLVELDVTAPLIPLELLPFKFVELVEAVLVCVCTFSVPLCCDDEDTCWLKPGAEVVEALTAAEDVARFANVAAADAPGLFDEFTEDEEEPASPVDCAPLPLATNVGVVGVVVELFPSAWKCAGISLLFKFGWIVCSCGVRLKRGGKSRPFGNLLFGSLSSSKNESHR